ncbi:MAG: GrlR family regulatory protein [Sneathiella sp.]
MDGLYKAEFKTPFGNGAAVFYLKNGALHGGNSALYYVGEYNFSGSQFHATLQTDRHTYDLNIASVFGMDQLNVTLEGIVEGDMIAIDGVADEVPDMQLRGKLTRLCD